MNMRSLFGLLGKGKGLALALACMLVIGGATGGSIAWLVGQSVPVHNTFTYGDIVIEVTESDTGDGDNNPHTNRYQMMPGADLTKDPRVYVLAGSEDSWLFVRLDKSANFDAFMTFAVAEGWTALGSTPDVYWRLAPKQDLVQEYQVLEGDKVSVHPEVNLAMLRALTEETFPTLTITAYAVQTTAVESAEAAWALTQQSTPAQP